ncbi:phosphonate C-P lyase system protein PhnG [Rhizobium sp. SSA_523]|uniref:phosphonate C-P lyase system protein PhnG n=1 Tax=Rhizobium sp. SSA_523 TaxID=2952477 RepID=UPI00209076E5|nr:phosphonate C-P lyase system protein PhnG [Rhizobium sp. SSA_523]MCO5733206.1 phosphonate C-P lyase system protein PhnG [Rhizobium sp. SSA_523]WKC22558.1 phosphonate C-P lyase system protein PhnG [Rhizobium sp. SSA_523]
MNAQTAGPNEPIGEPDPRKQVLDLLARCSLDDLQNAWSLLETRPDFRRLRGPESGLVMVRGRIGGGGSPFNLGETTVSRATIQLQDGTVGHAYRLGTDRKAAELAAAFDALWQADDTRAFVEEQLLAPVRTRRKDGAERLSGETAATKVDFFTMVRGED